MIGNSLSRNTQPNNIPQLARQQGNTFTGGWHIKSGASLLEIWHSPDSVQLFELPPSPSGKFTTALPNNIWDAVTLQPYYGPDLGTPLDANIENDLFVIKEMIVLTRQNPNNADTVFYLYQSWPQTRGSAVYQDNWDAGIHFVNGRILDVPRASYFNLLLERLDDETDAKVGITPVAEVLYALDVKMQAGEMPGYSSINELIDDSIHLNDGLGEYISGATVYATLFKSDPEGLTKPIDAYNLDGGGDTSAQFTPELYEVVHETIWEVVSTHPNTFIPEPTSASLVLLGGAALLRRRRA